MSGGNPKVAAFIGRATKWQSEMLALRTILLDCGLGDEIKWGKPCFKCDVDGSGGNILIFQPMKNFLSVMFFKGQLMDDSEGILRSQGPNSQSALRIEFSDLAMVRALEETVRTYVAQAIAIEVAGLKAEFKEKEALDLVPELRERLDADKALKEAFEALTPGRQRGYNLHFSNAKQSKTRADRVERVIPRILDGLGMNDR